MRISGSNFKWATSIGTPSRKSINFNCKLANATAGVAPSTYTDIPEVNPYLHGTELNS
jgi:hypothetical protein